MGAVPFRTFTGSLKQLAPDDLSPTQQALFDLLFPAFRGSSAADEAFAAAQQNPLATAMAPFIQVAPGERRPRRYAGFDFPRSRYFAVCADGGGDAQTLAHELRAYRDPIDVGMVEVLDLANGCVLSVRESTTRLAAQEALAVLVHEPQRLPAPVRGLAHQTLPGLAGEPLEVHLFPYRVTRVTVEKTIDLRYPEVRDWLYKTFRVPSDEAGAAAAPDFGPGLTPTTARSRFTFENARPPVPDSFWSMLPTLINPDLGGGNPGDTGSTFVMIGHWMRQNGVGGLVYPSARCDVAAVFQDGALTQWQGWNLLDYRGATPPCGAGAHVVTFVMSPWAWTSLPPGTRLHVAADSSRLAGSFAVENMVNYWAQDYLGQLKALAVARAEHGREVPRSERRASHDGLPFRAFQMGALSLRWLRLAVQQVPAKGIESSIQELQGLALPYAGFPITGRILEQWPDVRRGETTVNTAVASALTVGDLLSHCFQKEHAGQEIDKLVRIGADLELILLFLAMRERAGKQHGGMDHTEGFLREAGAALATSWLGESLRGGIAGFHRSALQAVREGGGQVGAKLAEGERLQRSVYDHLRSRGDHR